MEKIIIIKDGAGYLAEIKGVKNIYAYGNTKEEAMKELLGVLEMMMDYYKKLMINKATI